MARDGTTEAAARARIAAQIPVEDKRRFAHFVIDGSLSFEQTNRQTDDLAERLRALASSPPARVDLPPARGLAALVHGPRQGPRGLTPAVLVREIVEAGGVEMPRVAARLVPPTEGPWYRAADLHDAEPGPETLAAPVALWSLARRGDDPEYTASVAASMARLTHLAAPRIADACLLALALASAARRGLEPVRDRWPRLERLAERWGGIPPTGRGAEVLELALRHPDDPAAARAGAPDPVGSLAGALVGMARGTAAGAPPELAEDLASLTRLRTGPTE